MENKTVYRVVTNGKESYMTLEWVAKQIMERTGAPLEHVLEELENAGLDGKPVSIPELVMPRAEVFVEEVPRRFDYQVRVQRSYVHEGYVTVRAESEPEALELARDQIGDVGLRVTDQLDEDVDRVEIVGMEEVDCE